MTPSTISTPLRRAVRYLATALPQQIRIDSANGQMPYTTTNRWHAAMNFLPKPSKVPRYHYPIILTSVFIFTMYFAFLREKNEFDLIFEQPPRPLAPLQPTQDH
ncbi:hypothetical protein ECG_08788 [Echinococcus granulosus]|nr:hypothetical protein ECG_08788 [Echinococcus granulosus]CDS23654.1 expressed conserved protein [Echinococcus granulosus]